MSGVIAPSTANALRLVTPGVLDTYAANMGGLIASRVFPIVPVNHTSATFLKRVAGQTVKQTQATKRVSGAEARETSMEYTQDSYLTNWYSEKRTIVDRDKAAYANLGADLPKQSQIDLLYSTMLQHEQLVVSALHNTTNFPLSGTTGLDTTVTWATTATATPVQDVNAAKSGVEDRCGLTPNTIIIPSMKIARQILMSVEARSSIGLSQNQSTNLGLTASAETIAALFDIPKVLIAGATKVNDYQPSGTVARVWSESYVWVGVTGQTSMIDEPCVGKTLSWNRYGGVYGGKVYRDDKLEADVYEYGMDIDAKLLSNNFGFLLKID